MIVAPAMIIASSIFGAYNQKRQADAEAKQLEQNAAFARLQAEDAVARGRADTMVVRQRAKQLIGSQRASMAAQGIDLGYGSAIDIQADTGMMAEMDAVTVRNNAAREAWGYQAQAVDFGNRSAMTKAAGRNNAITTLMTGGINAYGARKG